MKLIDPRRCEYVPYKCGRIYICTLCRLNCALLLEKKNIVLLYELATMCPPRSNVVLTYPYISFADESCKTGVGSFRGKAGAGHEQARSRLGAR